MKHALLSASSSARWLICPGSVAENAAKDRSTTNEHAMLGTAAHALLETCLRLGCEPAEFMGVVLLAEHPAVDKDMCVAVAYALEYIHEYVENNPGTKVLVEHRVHYGKVIGTTDELAFGTSDVLLCNAPKELVCIDYKHGTGVSVSVKNNSQLQLYLLGRRVQQRYRRYRAVVVQPRLRDRKPVQQAPSMTNQQLDAFAKQVAKVVPIALAPGAPRKAGSHCHYCAAHDDCPERYRLKLESAKKDFSEAP